MTRGALAYHFGIDKLVSRDPRSCKDASTEVEQRQNTFAEAENGEWYLGSKVGSRAVTYESISAPG